MALRPFTDHTLRLAVWKDELPVVHRNNAGSAYVRIRQGGERVTFASIPGDSAQDLFTMAAAYLALAEAAERAEKADIALAKMLAVRASFNIADPRDTRIRP